MPRMRSARKSRSRKAVTLVCKPKSMKRSMKHKMRKSKRKSKRRSRKRSKRDGCGGADE